MDNNQVYIGFRLLCIAASLIFFGVSYTFRGDQPRHNQFVSAGFIALVASMIRWW